MKHLKIMLLTLVAIISAPQFGAQRPPQPPQLPWEIEAAQDSQKLRQRLTGLPNDVQQEILNTYFYAPYPNLAKVAERILAFKDKINTSSLIRFFEGLPYLANAVDLATNYLQNSDLVKNPQTQKWLKDAKNRLSHGKEFFSSTVVGQMREKEFNALLADKTVDLNYKDPESGFSPLERSVDQGEVKRVRLLLNAGANPNLQNIFGYTPLMTAAALTLEDRRANVTQITKDLIAAGAKVNLRANHDQTALLFAIQNGHKQIVRDLLAAGADPELLYFNGKTARAIALERNHPEIVKLIDDAIAERKAKMEKK